MSGTDFSALPELAMPYRDSDRILVTRDRAVYRGGPHPSLAGRPAAWALFQYRRPAGTSGGVLSPPNIWLTLGFNYADPANEFGSLTMFPDTGWIQLGPGRYQVTGWLTGMEGGSMRARLRLANGGAVIYSASAYSRHYSCFMPIQGLLPLSGPAQLVVELRCDRASNRPWGLGYRTQLGPEIYGSLLFTRRED